jgi:hypothetical protein
LTNAVTFIDIARFVYSGKFKDLPTTVCLKSYTTGEKIQLKDSLKNMVLHGRDVLAFAQTQLSQRLVMSLGYLTEFKQLSQALK